MDNKFAKSRMSIGESSNLAQLAMTYYWTNPDNKELYDNFVILSVLLRLLLIVVNVNMKLIQLLRLKELRKMECMNLTKVWV